MFGYAALVKAVIIGCGRVGSSVAKRLDREGWEVNAVDEREEALSRLGENWGGGFIVGHGSLDVKTARHRPTAVSSASDGHG